MLFIAVLLEICLACFISTVVCANSLNNADVPLKQLPKKQMLIYVNLVDIFVACLVFITYMLTLHIC